MYNVTSDYAKEHFEQILQRAKTEPDGVLIVQNNQSFVLLEHKELQQTVDNTQPETDMIEYLLNNPIELDNFTPLKREEIYDRKSI